MKRIHLLTTLALAGSLMACDKEDEQPQASEILMARSWAITGMVEELKSGVALNTYANLDGCFTDNQFTFQGGNKLTYDEGREKCDPQDPQAYTGTWSLKDNKVLTATVPMGSQGVQLDLEFGGTIEQLSATRIVVAQTDTTGGVTRTIRTTFTAK